MKLYEGYTHLVWSEGMRVPSCQLMLDVVTKLPPWLSDANVLLAFRAVQEGL